MSDTPRTDAAVFPEAVSKEPVVPVSFARALEREIAALNSIVAAADFATTAECTCGGNGENDPKACPACKIYHRIQAAKRAAATP